MAITVRATSNGPSQDQTSTTIVLPTGTVAGDLTVIAGAFNGATVGNSVTIPAGWTTVANCNGMFACYRKFVTADPGTVTFTTSDTGAFWQTVAASFIGCDATTPVDVTNSYFSLMGSAPVATWRAPSVAPKFSADVLLACFVTGDDLGDTLSLPAGFSTVIQNDNGPSILIASKQLSGAAQTGDQVTTSNHANQPKAGFQIALHASGDTPAAAAAPIISWGGLYTAQPVASSITVPLSRINAQQNDLTCVAISVFGETFATPSGWTLQGAGQDYYLFTRVFQTADPDPTFVAAGSSFCTVVAFLLRATNGGLSTIAATNTATGTGTPSSCTLSTITPANANDYLVATWGQNSDNGYTWTPDGTLTTQVQATNGPSILVEDIQPAAQPTGTFTAVSSGNPATFAVELLVIPPAGAVAGGAVIASIIT